MLPALAPHLSLTVTLPAANFTFSDLIEELKPAALRDRTEGLSWRTIKEKGSLLR